MKYVFQLHFFLFLLIGTASCSSKKILIESAGKLSIASTKNLDVNAQYAMLSRHAGLDESQANTLSRRGVKAKIKRQIFDDASKLKGNSVEQAIANLVESVPGGVFAENVEIYYMFQGKGKDDKEMSFIASGDVYGFESGKKRNVRGFQIGDRALYREKKEGTVITLIDDQYCLWRELPDKKGEKTPIKVLYDELIKIEK